MSSRDLADLIPSVREKVGAWVTACAAQGVTVLVYCTLRSPEEQAELYTHGRSAPGPKVTNAKPWQSAHQYGRAVDAVPMRSGKPLWRYDQTAPEWIAFAEEAERVGLEWAGRWTRFKEFVHVQDLSGKTIAELYADHFGGVG